MSVQKRKGRKNLYSVFYLPNGKQKWVSTGTSDETEAAIIDKNLQLAQKGNVSRDRIVNIIDQLMGHEDHCRLLLTDSWEKYLSLRSVKKLGKETLRKRKLAWNRMLRFVQEHYPHVKHLRQIDRHIAFAYADWLFDHTPKGKTFNNLRGDVVTIVNKLTYQAGLQENVFSLTETADESDSISGRAFTDQEVKAILNVAKDQGEYYGAVLIALYTGLRFSDLAFLEWEEIQGDIFNLLPSKTKKHKIRVMVPMHSKVKTFFRNLEKSDDRWVFPDLQNSYGYGSRRSKFTNILKKAGIDTKKDGVKSLVTFHSFRHTFATNLASSGVSQEIRMRLGGWKNENIAEIYNHDTTALSAAIKLLK